MAFVTIEDRVDRLEALFGQFLTEGTIMRKHADERDRAAEERHQASEERHRAAEERHRAAEERHHAAEERMCRFEQEMREFKDEMREFKDEMRVFKDEMRQSKRDLDKKWGDLANKMGTIVEDILAPNLYRLATDYFGFPHVEQVLLRWSRKKPNQPSSWQEFDAVLIGTDSVLVGEAKSSTNVEAVERFARKLSGFPDFAPHLAHLKIIPVMGCWSMPDDAIERLSDLGIYAMCMGDDTMDIVNGDHITRK